MAAVSVSLPIGLAVGYEKLTVDNTAGGVALTLPSVSPLPDAAFVTVESNPARYKVTGAPTTTDGHLVDASDAFILRGNQLSAFRAIRTGGSSATFHVTYFCTLFA